MRAMTWLGLAGLAAMMMTGCGPKKEEIPAMEPADIQAPATTPTLTPATTETPPVRVEKRPPARSVPAVTREPPPPLSPPPPAAGQTYTIQKGDTLYSLARRFYGDGKLWTRIADANKDKIKDVSHIPLGTVLTIPPK